MAKKSGIIKEKREGISTLVVNDEEVVEILNLIVSINEKLKDYDLSYSSEELLFRWKSIVVRNYCSAFMESNVVVRFITEYCLNRKDYYFTNNISINNAIKDGIKIDIDFWSANTDFNLVGEISLNNMVKDSVIKAIEYRDNVECFVKSDFIKLCYGALRDYKRFKLNPTQKRQFTHYKLTVLTGLIVLKIKPDLFEKFQYSIKNNEYLTPSEIKGIIVSETNKCKV